MIGFLLILLFIVIFGAVQSVMYLKYNTTPAKEALKKFKKAKDSSIVRNFVIDKQLQLKKMGAGILLKDQMTVSQWYLYKMLMAGLFFCICLFVTDGIFKSSADMLILLAENVYVYEVYDSSGNKVTGKDEIATSFTVYVTEAEVENLNLAVCYGGIQMYLKTE